MHTSSTAPSTPATAPSAVSPEAPAAAPSASAAPDAPAAAPLDLSRMEPPRRLSESRLEDVTIDGICGVY